MAKPIEALDGVIAYQSERHGVLWEIVAQVLSTPFEEIKGIVAAIYAANSLHLGFRVNLVHDTIDSKASLDEIFVYA